MGRSWHRLCEKWTYDLVELEHYEVGVAMRLWECEVCWGGRGVVLHGLGLVSFTWWCDVSEGLCLHQEWTCLPFVIMKLTLVFLLLSLTPKKNSYQNDKPPNDAGRPLAGRPVGVVAPSGSVQGASDLPLGR